MIWPAIGVHAALVPNSCATRKRAGEGHPIATRIQFITRFVAYLPDAGESSEAELAHVARTLAGTGLRLLRSAGHVLAVTGPSSSAPQEATNWLLDVFPGTAASPRLAAAGFEKAGTLEELHAKAETSAQSYNLIRSTDTEFALESDALGIKPAYAARTPAGHVIASCIADILHLFPASAGPIDAVGLCELLGFWAPLMGRTLHRHVRRAPPGACFRWTRATGLECRADRRFQAAAVEPLWFMDQAIEAIHDASMTSLQEKIAGTGQPALLALSGGFDSRFIAALCRERKVGVRAVTYGRRHHIEVRAARAVARSLGLELKLFRQERDAGRRDLQGFVELTEGTVDPGVMVIMHLLRDPSEPGSAMLHGFCGDLHAGSHFDKYRAVDYASRESVAEAVTAHYFPPERLNLLELFGGEIRLDDIRQDVLAGLRGDCTPQEAYSLWYLENRNRRYVGAEFALLGEHFDVVMPFYDRRLVGLWHSIPPIGRSDRAAFRRLMAHYYPQLARIPHPEEATPISPNLHWQLARAWNDSPRLLLDRVVGRKRSEAMRLRWYRHDNIRSLGHFSAPQQRAYMLAQVGAALPALGQALGVTLSANYGSILSGDLQALRSMYAVARYAERLRGSRG